MDNAGLADGAAAGLAVLAALAWPLVLMIALVRFRPPPTASERAAASARLQARIAELEAELHGGEP